MNNIQKKLLKARNLIAKDWVKGAWAIDANGDPVSPYFKNYMQAAVCFCALGAMYKAFDCHPHELTGRHSGPDQARRCLLKAVGIATGEPTGFHQVSWFNDHHETTQESMLFVCDMAIELAGELN